MYNKLQYKYNQTSRFWLDEYSYRSLLNKDSNSVNLSEVIEKFKILKTIGNFVNIVTGESYPVKFEGDQAFTNGKEITISADCKDFDSVCGLSIHEASHIKYSQDLYKVFELVSKEMDYLTNGSKVKDFKSPIVNKLVDICKKLNKPLKSTAPKLLTYIHELINIVEDARIDAITQKEFPGYKGYYDALYLQYIYTPTIAQKLKEPILNEESYFSYKVNLLLFLSKHLDNNLLKLKGGSEIEVILDVKNIYKISAMDVLDKVFKIYDIISKNVIEKPKQLGNNKDSKLAKLQKSKKSNGNDSVDFNLNNDLKNDESNESSKNENSEDKSEDKKYNKSKSNESDELESSESNTKDSDNKDSDNKHTSNEGDATSSTKNLDDELFNDATNSVSEPFKDLINYINGKSKKTKLSTSEINLIKLFSNNKFKIKKTVVFDPINNKKYNINVVVVNKLDESILQYLPELAGKKNSHIEKMVNAGLNLGKSLGSKLQLMNDSHLDVSIRRKTGDLNGRLLAEIGLGNTKIFDRKTIKEYKKQFIHISIDSSYSMTGRKWNDSLKMAATICSAAKFVNGMRVQVSIRSTAFFTLGDEIPYVAIIFDSKFDDISHIRNWWPRLKTPGITPEAICFEAIKDIILESSKDKNSYFINISDGDPCYSRKDGFYYSDFAAEHTQSVMKLFKNAGIKIISYFIDDNKNTNTYFSKMYGKDAQFIDCTNLNEIARSLNKRFLST